MLYFYTKKIIFNFSAIVLFVQLPWLVCFIFWLWCMVSQDISYRKSLFYCGNQPHDTLPLLSLALALLSHAPAPPFWALCMGLRSPTSQSPQCVPALSSWCNHMTTNHLLCVVWKHFISLWFETSYGPINSFEVAIEKGADESAMDYGGGRERQGRFRREKDGQRCDWSVVVDDLGRKKNVEGGEEKKRQ